MIFVPDGVPCNSEYAVTPLINNKKRRAFCAFQNTTGGGGGGGGDNYLKC